MGRVMAQSMAGGVSSKVIGGEFADGFKVALITSAAAYVYSAYSQGYNKLGGKPHLLQDGKSDIGINSEGVARAKLTIANDSSSFMKFVGKIPTFDSMAEFHDGWTGQVHWLAKPGLLQVSIVPAVGLNLAATYSEYYSAFDIAKYVNNRKYH